MILIQEREPSFALRRRDQHSQGDSLLGLVGVRYVGELLGRFCSFLVQGIICYYCLTQGSVTAHY